MPVFAETVTDPAGTVTADKRPVFTWRTPEGLIAAIQVQPSRLASGSVAARSQN